MSYPSIDNTIFIPKHLFVYNQVHFLNTFTGNDCGGNPTAVYVSHRPLESEAMQLLAKELFVPVTAFVWKGENYGCIRYFTNICEIPACGHATLGAAAVVATILSIKTSVFQTGGGLCLHTFVQGGIACMEYPHRALAAATPEEGLWTSMHLIQEEVIETLCFEDTLVIVLKSAALLTVLQPDFRQLQASTSVWKEVVITAAASKPGYDYLLRSFCPWIGIDEDPVTGSVQAALAPYWAKKLGKQKLNAYQASERGGELSLCVENEGVQISGSYRFLSAAGNNLRPET